MTATCARFLGNSPGSVDEACPDDCLSFPAAGGQQRDSAHAEVRPVPARVWLGTGCVDGTRAGVCRDERRPVERRTRGCTGDSRTCLGHVAALRGGWALPAFSLPAGSLGIVVVGRRVVWVALAATVEIRCHMVHLSDRDGAHAWGFSSCTERLAVDRGFP